MDNKELEANLRKRTEEMGLHATKVTCPDGVEPKPGRVFTCQIELDGKKLYALDVTIKNVDAESKKLTYDTAWHDGPAVQTAKLEPALAAELGKALGGPVAIRCGDEPLRFLDAQHKLHCELTAGEAKTSATIDFDAALNATDWHLDPPLLAKAKLEAALTPAVHAQVPDAAIDCGTAAFIRRPADGTVWCSITSGAQHGKLKVEVDDALNVKRWEIVAT